MSEYYTIARRAGKSIGTHPGLKYLADRVRESKKVLDVGCGEGSRLTTLLLPRQSGWGVDINPKAIDLAKKQYPRHRFVISRGEDLPFPKNYFDLAYTAFTLEHTVYPEKVIAEMLRVCRPGGEIIILCPNYGAPNRRSPVSDETPAKKILKGIIDDFSRAFKPSEKLDWHHVRPRQSYNRIDDDTTVEPYVFSLLIYLKQQGLQITNISSLWQLEAKPENLRKKLFLFLGRSNIFPFEFWGPQVFVSALKPSHE
ncbi:hypothetical protein A2701_02125 [Candidatus Amesbacteria bacterium RIFCSPHIGHO2_01_FULL_47_34]|nr:MAG: hypothetical protein A2701_02125 [Candidatus Amesbacteria bacterium RIFCSPHIGHO2_01_FULL_47_34]